MSEDEEVLVKGSELYNYLQTSGFSNFESVDSGGEHNFNIKPGSGSMEIVLAAPQWAIEHLDNILRCGLILEDHRHFVECFKPLQTKRNYLYLQATLCGISWAGVLGGLLLFTRHSSPRKLVIGFATCASAGALYFSRNVRKLRRQRQSVNLLSNTLSSLESLYIQLKRMILLVQQNELIAHSFSLRCSEMIGLRKGVRGALYTCLQGMFRFIADIKEVPLSHSVDSSLHSFSWEDMAAVPNPNDDNLLSLECLKKLFHTYVLLESEFLRRLALCYCPEMWLPGTLRTLLKFARQNFPKITNWATAIHKKLVQDHKMYRAMSGSRQRTSLVKMTSSPSWDFTDLYVAVRSASLHLQSSLVQTQDIEDILESEAAAEGKDNKEFLGGLVQVLTDVQKELRTTLTCVDEGLGDVFKLLNNGLKPVEQVAAPDPSRVIEKDAEVPPDSEVNPPAVDEVFEIIIPQEGIENVSEDDEDLDDEAVTNRERQGKEREASKRVLLELKTVLVKKADEWREREKKAMESKGMVYSAPEQVQMETETESDSATCSGVDWLPTESQNVWPLPRLKECVPSHRRRPSRPDRSRPPAPLQQSDLRKARELEKKEAEKETESKPRIGFGVSLLAEAMAKSKSMQQSRTEDVFGSDDDGCCSE